MRSKRLLPLLATLASSPLAAQVTTESVRVEVRIVDGVADTTVALRIRNDDSRPGEKVLVLPLPEGATADRLEMTVGGKLQTGEVLDKDRARQVYETIVRRRLDPALLEYAGRDTLRLHVFPVPPRGHQDVHIRFRMLLREISGMHSFEFPARAIEGGTFAMDIAIESRKAIKNVYSPLQDMDVARKDDHHARASYECKGRPTRDPAIFYGLSDRDFGLNLLTYRRQGEDGYFLLMLAPKRDWQNEKELRKSITFVLDTSGSMEGEKIAQARGALEFFLACLRPTDSFNLVPFSTEARPFAPRPVTADNETVEKARKFVSGLAARGGTNIADALTAALQAPPAPEAVSMVVFLTDGLPTVGETDIEKILTACAQANAARTRIFVLGVGHDVNTHLLDALADQSRGTRDYVKPGEDLEIKTSALFEKLAHPVMTDLALACDGIESSQMVPKDLPDLFRGSRLVVAGCYRGEGARAIRLRGRVADLWQEHVYDATFPAISTQHDFVATLWAQRRVGQLLDAIRLNGRKEELVSEVRRLGVEHGLVTPFTSGLVVEEPAPVARAGGRVYRGPGNAAPPPRATGHGGRYTGPGDIGPPGGQKAPPAAPPSTPGSTPRGPVTGGPATGSDGFGGGSRPAPNSGATAVRESTEAARRQYLATLDEKTHDRRTRRVGGRLFQLVDGVWIDRAFGKKLADKVRKVRAFSDEYFALLRQHSDLAQVLALGPAIVVVVDGEAIEVVPGPPEAKKEDATTEANEKKKD